VADIFSFGAVLYELVTGRASGTLRVLREKASQTLCPYRDRAIADCRGYSWPVSGMSARELLVPSHTFALWCQLSQDMPQ
jgi:hypothetical protein